MTHHTHTEPYTRLRTVAVWATCLLGSWAIVWLLVAAIVYGL